MPPRFSYWTIIAGGLPTAFRAADREELLPTFTRLKEKQPDAEMKWFARGKLWASPEEARGGGSDRGARPRDWRPGGTHRDPRQPFKDAKRARNQRVKAEKFERRHRRDDVPRERPHGDPLAPERRTGHDGSRHGSSRETRKPWGAAAHGGASNAGSRPPRDKHARPAGRDNRDPRRHDHPRTESRGGDRREQTAKAPRGDWRAKDPRGDWRAKAPRDKPHGDKLMRPPHKHGDSRPKDGGRPDWSNRDRNRSPRNERDRDDRQRVTAPKTGTDTRRPDRDQGRAAFRGQGHGNNSWKPKPPRETGDASPQNRRPFAPASFDRERRRSGAGSEPPSQPPRRPNREPRPNENPQPSAPPRPSEPIVPPPGPPERGRLNRNKRTR
jgi:hypothetical protein